MNLTEYKRRLFNDISQSEFEELSLMAFRYQFENNIVYRQYCDYRRIKADSICEFDKIPFLPISFYKTGKIISTESTCYTIFESSSTTGNITSKHYVSDIELYERAFFETFNLFYGDPGNYVLLALLPSYLERKNSSLVYMVNSLLKRSRPGGGFYLNNLEKLRVKIFDLENKKSRYILFGVSFALLDFALKYSINCDHGIIMETGGMKGRRKEIIRDELHKILSDSFGVSVIHSEYGMTEMLSQAYSRADGLFECPPWMKVLVRETSDPLTINHTGIGALNIIDLANINSCCFIETSDLGSVKPDGSFTVSGRFDFAEVRGCNLMSG